MSLFSQIYAQGSVLSAGLRGTAARNEIIVNNIANADVPGFRARALDFEDHLTNLLGNYPHPRFRARFRGIEQSDFIPTVRYRNPGLFYRRDGNTVDIDIEMVNLYQNHMRFDTIVSSIMANSQRLRTVLERSG